MRRFIVVTAAALVALTGCGGGGSNGASSASDHGDVAVGQAPKSAGGGTAAGTESVRLAPQAIVYTADLSMRAGDVHGAEAEAKRIVAGAALAISAADGHP